MKTKLGLETEDMSLDIVWSKFVQGLTKTWLKCIDRGWVMHDVSEGPHNFQTIIIFCCFLSDYRAVIVFYHLSVWV